MPQVDPVTLRLFVENGQAVSALNKYGRVADQQFSLVEKGARGVESALGSLKGVLAGVSAAALARSFLDIADTAKTLDAQLKLATAGFGSFAQAQDDVRQIAADTRSGLEETASLYGNFTRNARELGITQEQAGRATETVTKAFKISGASAVDASQGTRQLVQALQSGVLRGDEFNTMAESAPRLQRLLADSLGVTQGELRKMAEAGELTSNKLTRAFTDKKFTAGIDAEFREMPVTFDQAMTQVNNAAIITFGAFDRGGQFSTALANFVSDGSSGFADLEHSAAEFGIAARANIEGLVGAFEPVFAEGKRLFDYLSGGFQGIDIGRDIQKSLDQVDMITSKVGGSNFGGRNRERRAAAERRLRGEQGERAVNALISPYLDRFGKPVQRAAPARPAAAKPAGGAKKPGAGATNSAETAARKAENDRLKGIRDEASKARESAQLQDDINTAKAALAVATRDVLAFNQDQIQSEKNQRIAEYETQRKLGNLTEQEFADRKAAVEQIADLQNQRVIQIAQENERREALDVAQAANQNQQDLYRAQADLTASREERHAVELRLVQLAYDQERAELEGVLASQTSTQAQKDIAAARLAILGQLQGASERQVDRQNEGPLDRYRRDLDNPDRGKDQVESAVIDELEAVRDSISSAVQKTLGVKNPILAALIDSFIEQQFIRPFLDGVAGAGGGGGFNPVGAIKGLLGFSSGGYTGDGPKNQVAGVVHRGEYVVPAETVKRLGVQNLEGLASVRAAASMAGTAAARPSQAPIIKQTVHVDARNSVNPQGFAQQILSVTAQQAQQAAGLMGKAVSKGMPSRLSSYQRDGT